MLFCLSCFVFIQLCSYVTPLSPLFFFRTQHCHLMMWIHCWLTSTVLAPPSNGIRTARIPISQEREKDYPLYLSNPPSLLLLALPSLSLSLSLSIILALCSIDWSQISLSIGLTADFCYKNHYDDTTYSTVQLQSGDVLIFGGPSRMIVHSVQAVYICLPPSFLPPISHLPSSLTPATRCTRIQCLWGWGCGTAAREGSTSPSATS